MLLNEQVNAANTAIYISQASHWYLSTLSTWSPNSMVDGSFETWIPVDEESAWIAFIDDEGTINQRTR
jgi:hypothetical protein